jgi:hypothetical protein
MWTIWKSKECVGSSYVQWLLLVESARQDLGLQQRTPLTSMTLQSFPYVGLSSTCSHNF